MSSPDIQRAVSERLSIEASSQGFRIPDEKTYPDIYPRVAKARLRRCQQNQLVLGISGLDPEEIAAREKAYQDAKLSRILCRVMKTLSGFDGIDQEVFVREVNYLGRFGVKVRAMEPCNPDGTELPKQSEAVEARELVAA